MTRLWKSGNPELAQQIITLVAEQYMSLTGASMSNAFESWEDVDVWPGYFFPTKTCFVEGCSGVSYHPGPGDDKWRCADHQKERQAKLDRVIDQPEYVRRNLCPPPWRF